MQFTSTATKLQHNPPTPKLHSRPPRHTHTHTFQPSLYTHTTNLSDSSAADCWPKSARRSVTFSYSHSAHIFFLQLYFLFSSLSFFLPFFLFFCRNILSSPPVSLYISSPPSLFFLSLLSSPEISLTSLVPNNKAVHYDACVLYTSTYSRVQGKCCD